VAHASGASTTPRCDAGAIDAAEVAVVLLDASEPISEQDQRVIGMASRPAARW
jgi:GTP-binding protein